VVYPGLSEHLKLVALLLGGLYIVTHSLAFIKPAMASKWLTDFPRNHAAGVVLTLVNVAWAAWLLYHLDVGNFHKFRPAIVLLSPVIFYLLITYIDHFLSVRALGCFLLLAACALLKACFLREETSRLFIVVLAYVWIVAGMYFVGAPYLLRNLIQKVTVSHNRLKLACAPGVLYGIMVVILSVFFIR